MHARGEFRGRGLSMQIAVRLAIAALLLSLLEIVVVLVYYGSNHAKLAEQVITLQANRVGSVVREANAPQAMRERLAGLAAPTGAVEWSFAIHDSNRNVVFKRPWKSPVPDLNWPSRGTFDWTLSEPFGDDTLVSGGRHLPAGDSDIRVTLGVRGNGLSMFAAVLAREALDHVVLPVMPLILLLLAVNVQIVRRMLAPLSSAAAQVNALDPARLDSRLHVPGAAHEVQALVVAVNHALDRLKHAMTVLESFTADAAHELRTPLSVLRLRVDSLEPGPLKDRLSEDLTAMTRLVDQLLDLAQADALHFPPDSVVHLQELASDVVARLQPVAFARNFELRLIDRGGGSVAGHSEALSRALTNLIDNAMEHSPPGAAIDVIVGPHARLAVRDRGAGIPQEIFPLLFTRFFRGPSEAGRGAGLGLSIVHSIVTSHGATITARNADGGGAIFAIEWNDQVSAPSRSTGTDAGPGTLSNDDVATKHEPHTGRTSLSRRNSDDISKAGRSAVPTSLILCCALLLHDAIAQAAGDGLRAIYTADVLRNASGGIRTGTCYLDNLDLMLEVDVAETLGQGGGTLFVYGLYNNHTTFADELVGDLLVSSNIDAPAASRLYELWYEFGEGPWSVRTGLYDLNSEFDVHDTGRLFLNSAHGIGAAFSQTGENGPSIFPVTSLALRAALEVRDATLRLAVLDGVPGDPDDPSSNEINLSAEDGALLVGEVEMPFAESARAWTGYWRYTADFERPFDSGRSNDNAGWYLGVESRFELGPHPAAWFVRYGRANESLNPLQAYLGGGVVIDGIIASRPEDQLGLSVASGRSGGPYRSSLERTRAGATAHETQWELTYRAQINEHLALQPDLQYVQNPAASQELENAWIVGLRLELTL